MMVSRAEFVIELRRNLDRWHAELAEFGADHMSEAFRREKASFIAAGESLPSDL